jgi:FkbM family methyltransferase
MIINGNSKRILFKELEGDIYGLKALKQNSVSSFIDFGAAYGTVSILARLLHPSMKIFAVEPHQLTYSFLSTNVINLYISAVNIAFGTGVDFYLQKERKMLLCNHFSANPTHLNKVNSLSLSQFVSKYKIPTNSLAIKMDVEGAEWCIFENEGDMNIIHKCKLAAFEVHDNGTGNTVKKFFDLLKFEMADSHKVSINYLSKTLALIKASC